jgi:hypothetical protein
LVPIVDNGVVEGGITLIPTKPNPVGHKSNISLAKSKACRESLESKQKTIHGALRAKTSLGRGLNDFSLSKHDEVGGASKIVIP